MATESKSSKDRASRERARLYAARTELHEAKIKRRVRDNVIAGAVGGVLLLGAIGAQVAYFTAGPGKVEPTPALTDIAPIETEVPNPVITGEPTELGRPAPTELPTPTTTP